MMLDVDGAPAYAYTGGHAFEPGRPVSVFVHGAQHDHSVWALQTRYFAHHGLNVLAVARPPSRASRHRVPDDRVRHASRCRPRPRTRSHRDGEPVVAFVDRRKTIVPRAGLLAAWRQPAVDGTRGRAG